MPQHIAVVAEAPATGSCVVLQQSTDGIVRRLVETLGRELETLNRLLEELYGSAFIDTAGDSPLTLVITIVDLAREPRVLAQIDAVVSEPERGKLEFQTSARGPEQAVLPGLLRCQPSRHARD